MTQKNDNRFVAAAWIVLGVLARLIPHPANVSPMSSISLFGGAQLSRGAAFGLTFVTLVASDILLALVNGHAAFGYWTLFTYSGFAAIILAGSLLRGRLTVLRTGGLITASSLGFWVWTNFGTWLLSGMYPRNGEGLAACFLAGLPFLQNALLGDLAWGTAFFLGFAGVQAAAPRFGWKVQSAG